MLLKLATKEMLRKKFRFITMSVIIGFITLLVLFRAAMSDGLALTSKEYIENTGAELIVFRDDVDISIPASRVGRSKLNDIERVEGVEAVGPIGFSVASILADGADGAEKIEVVLIGVEPGMPGMPEIREGAEFSNYRAGEVIIGQHDVVEELLIAMLDGGQCLLVGVPGLAKTLMVRTLADTLSLSFNRIQFTPD